jgi:glycosyltransferase involved in cell wall biosynthesis
MREIVEADETGLRFPPHNWAALADAVNSLIRDGDKLARLGRAARLTYLKRYTPSQNYRQLLEIYRQCLKAQQEANMHTSA